MRRQSSGRGRSCHRGKGYGRGGGQGHHNWQRKMLTKLVKDADAAFVQRDVTPFLEGMDSFESKGELLTLLADDRSYGMQRVQDCLQFIDPQSVDTIVTSILVNIINAETGRPLYKATRDNLVRAIYATPGLIEFLATQWVSNIQLSSQKTIDSIAEFLLVAIMASVDARNSGHVKTIANALRETTMTDSQIIHRLCAIIRLDRVETSKTEKPNKAAKAQTAVCWVSDLKPPGGRHDNDRANYRDISLIPTQEELGFEGMPFLPLSSGENVVIFDAEESLLDRNFRLLREDAIGTMRENIANPRVSKVWNNARIIGVSCKDAFNSKRTSCLYFLVQFDLQAQRKVNWDFLRSLPRDGLVALQRDGLAPMMATICVRTAKEKCMWLNTIGGPVVGLIFHHTSDITRALSDLSVNLSISKNYEEGVSKAESTNELARLKGSFLTYTMCETSDSFFSYRPVLEALQQMTSVPLAQNIVSLEPTISRSHYLPSQVRMPLDFGGLVCNLDEWSDDEIIKSTTLDSSQATALHLALTSRVALIQGPPGTGKTFIGGLVAQVIRDNSDESILCVCYTNHALDQFLTHMLKRGERRLVRIGGRTKSEALKRYELKELARTKEKSTNDATRRMNAVVAQMHRCNEKMTEHLEILKEPVQWSDLDDLFYSIDGNLYVNFPTPDSDDFQVVGRGNKRVDSESLFKMWKNGDPCPFWLEEIFHMQDIDFQNVWLLNSEDRLQLLNKWKQLHLEENIDALQEMAETYQDLIREKDMISREIDARILQDARVIGATTTGAAKYRDLLSIKSAGVVIVEEAGEVLEPHIISALSESTPNSTETKHLILIGDHKQLRPKVESYRLTKVSGHGYDFDVSLFERMIMAGYPSAMLQVQHRMRPCISALIREQTYPMLQDHKSVHEYPNVKGVTSNLLFINHHHPEDGANDSDATTKSNIHEASFCVEVVRHLLLQGYMHHQITILTPYVGQILKILRELRKLGNVSAYISELDQMDLLQEEEEIDESDINACEESKSIRCASIDNFQGEESDIVVVSLVRSNKRGAIGFMKEEQRVNVLLSRAKHGMFIVGNAATLQASPKGRSVWQPILKMLSNQGLITEGMPTVCQIHPKDVVICREVDDFKKYRPNGGCTRACGARLECGHTCPLTCHPTDIKHVLTHKQCVKPCRRIPTECKLNHLCQKMCNEECGDCDAIVEDTQLPCGHIARNPTCHSVRNQDAIIRLSSKCKEIVQFKFDCNHTCETTCANSRSKNPICEANCGDILNCGHPCQNRCGTCDSHTCKQKCDRTLFCGHICGRACHGSSKCNGCRMRCVVTCIHSKCRKLCSEVCSPCVEDCDWQCEHRGKCQMVCGAPCNRLPCEKRCSKLLDCGHQCPSVCGEDCPASLNCVVCCAEEKKKRQVDMILFTEYQDLDINADPIIFLPCGHFFSMSTVDGVIDLSAAYSQDPSGNYVDLKSLSNVGANDAKCPDCRSIIHSVKRYGRVTSLHCLRASERKHMMQVKKKLSFLSNSVNREGLDEEQLRNIIVRLNVLEVEIEQGPMLKVYQACGGVGLDAPSPTYTSFILFLRLKATVFGKLVNKSGDESYIKSLGTYKHGIDLAKQTHSKKQCAMLILDKSRLILRWDQSSDSIREEILNDMDWIIAHLKNVDQTIVADAIQLKQDALLFNRKKEIKDIVKAMNVLDGYDYGGSWSDHWYECPNGHPYFIGNCGQAMQQSVCPECGTAVGGSSHTLLQSNRSAGGMIADALRD